MGSTGDLYTGLSITITAPDGTKTTMGPYTADATGGVGGLSFTPTQLGNYTFQGTYPGQTLKSGTTYNGTIELPSTSTIRHSNRTTRPNTDILSPPLPTQYWSRPIYATNYALGSPWRQLVWIRSAIVCHNWWVRCNRQLQSHTLKRQTPLT